MTKEKEHPPPTTTSGGNVIIRPTASTGVRIWLLAFGLACCGIIGLALGVTFRSQGHAGELSRELKSATDQIADLKVEVVDLRAERSASAAVNDCRVRYQLDISIASAEATAAFNLNFARLLSFLLTPLPAGATESERDERVRQGQELSRQLAEPSLAYKAATDAYALYLGMIPAPSVCPHP